MSINIGIIRGGENDIPQARQSGPGAKNGI